MIVIFATILLTGWAVYETACLLVGGIGGFSVTRQQQFNATLFQYLLIFTILAIFISSFVHFYVTKKMISPINQLIDATKQLKEGTYPPPIPVASNDEIGKLIEHYNELLQELEKNETQRKKLIDDVSHELRTPLANLTGYLYALKTGGVQGDEALFAALYEQTVRLTSMVEQIELLNEWHVTSLAEQGQKEMIEISDIASQCVQMFSWKKEAEGIQLQAQLERARLYIYQEGIEQVMTILLDNAIRYYDGEGPIIVKGVKQAHTYELSVSGPGETIEAHDQAKLFDRFYRVEQSRSRDTGGTGLGLSIAKEIIENHNGYAGVQSRAGMNTFTCTLPLEKPKEI